MWAVSVRSKEALVYSPGASYAHSQDHLRQVRDDRTSTLANLGTAVHGDGLLMGIDGDPSCGWLGGGAPGLSCRCSPSCSRLMRSATSTSGRMAAALGGARNGGLLAGCAMGAFGAGIYSKAGLGEERECELRGLFHYSTLPSSSRSSVLFPFRAYSTFLASRESPALLTCPCGKRRSLAGRRHRPPCRCTGDRSRPSGTSRAVENTPRERQRP